MSYQQRIALYKEIEKIRQRPLLVYVTSLRPNASGQMAPDVIPEIIRQIIDIPDSYTRSFLSGRLFITPTIPRRITAMIPIPIMT